MSGATFKNKADIERKIIECGGSVVQNPGNEFALVNVIEQLNTVSDEALCGPRTCKIGLIHFMAA